MPAVVSPVLPGTTRLGEFVVEEAVQEWGKPQLNHSVMGKPLSIAGQKYLAGLGTHAASRIRIAFKPEFKSFSGFCGVDDWVGTGGSVVFKIRSDGKELFATPLLRGGMRPVEFSIPVEGLSSLVLLVENGDGNRDGDHADWVDLSLR
ncbi:MAG TPA: NPCBM/NEW2 domain-containing protein [Thermoanaerobaculia bacterium]